MIQSQLTARAAGLVLKTAFLTGCLALPALAASAADTAAAGTAPTGEQPTGEESSATQLGEVVVTARRRNEDLQQLPIAVTALSAATLDKNGITKLTEVVNMTPGFVISTEGPAVKPWIRGVGSQDVLSAQDSSVPIYLDGVYMVNSRFFNSDFNNIQSIEVDKGPQGTLFGRNSTGGAIQIRTRDPQQQPLVMGTVGYGNYNTVHTSLYATGGVTQDLAGDIALTYRDQGDGFGKALFGAVGEPQVLREGPKEENLAVRSKWLYTPTDATKITIAGDYAHVSRPGNPMVSVYPGTFTLDGQGQNYNNNFYNGVNAGVYSTDVSTAYGVTGKIEQSLGFMQLSSNTSYSASHGIQATDADSSRLPLVAVYNGTQWNTFIEEVQAQSKPSSRLKWVLGAMYLRDNEGFGGSSGIPNLMGLGLLGNKVAGPGAYVGINNKVLTKSYAVYGETTVPLGDTTNITLGARWTRDERSLIGTTQVLDATTFQPLVPTDPASTLGQVKFSKPTWRAILDHHFTAAVMGYASISRGYKSGNFDAVGGNSYGPEILTAYELGLKSELLDKRLRLNAAGYYYKYDGIQETAYMGPTELTYNAANAESAGFELSVDVVPVENFVVNFASSYMYSKFVDFKNAICYTPRSLADGGGNAQSICDLSGSRLPQTPKFTLSANPAYTLHAGFGQFVLSGVIYHVSSYRFSPGVPGFQPGYSTVDARLRFNAPEDRCSVTAWVKNLTKEKYYGEVASDTHLVLYDAAPPMTYGVDVSFRF